MRESYQVLDRSSCVKVFLSQQLFPYLKRILLFIFLKLKNHVKRKLSYNDIQINYNYRFPEDSLPRH